MKNLLQKKATEFVQKSMSGEIKSVKTSISNVEKVAKLGVFVGFIGVGYGVGLKNSLKTVIEHEDARVKDVEKQVSHANDEIEEIKEILASNNIVQRYPAHDGGAAQEEK